MSVTLLLAVGALVLAPLLGYHTAGRKLSGKIGTSEANDLWTESAKIRDDYRQQMQVANQRVVALEARVAEVERDNNALARENLELRAQVGDGLARLEACQAIVDRQQELIAELRARVAELVLALGKERGPDA